MTERDGAWMARILARFTPETGRGARGDGALHATPATRPTSRNVLEGRLERILERYLTRLSPIADVHVEGATGSAASTSRECDAVRERGGVPLHGAAARRTARLPVARRRERPASA